jgi:hypothetical protein
VRLSWRRGLAASAALALGLAACGDDTGEDPQDDAAPAESEGEGDEEALDDLMGDAEGMEDPNEDVEDGVYAGSGVLLPVPDGWQLDPQAAAQGAVVAVSEDQEQYLSGQAIDTAEAEAAGQPMDFDTVLDSVREQVGTEPDIDEEVELQNAEQAHRLTFTDLPAQQEGQPEQNATIVFADDGNGLLGQFEFAAATDRYDDAIADQLLAEAGFDPDSEPPEIPQQPAPEGEMPSEEELEELQEQMEQEQQDQ